MTFVKTVSDDRILLSRDNELYLQMEYLKEEARILYADPDRELIKTAQALANADGKKIITIDFPEVETALSKTFKELDYNLTNTRSIISVNTAELFDSKAVKKSMNLQFQDINWLPFRNLLLFELEEISQAMSGAGIPLNRNDLARFDDDLSGAIYDEDNKIQAFILASTLEDEIVIECLHGFSGSDPKYIMATLQGFATEMTDCDLLDKYRVISMIELSGTIRPLLKRLLDSKYNISDCGSIVHGSRNTEGDAGSLENVRTDDSFLTRAIAQKEIEERLNLHIHQRNINWKTRWVTSN